MTASVVKRELPIGNGSAKTTLKCLCITGCLWRAVVGEGGGQSRSLTRFNIDTCHCGLEAERQQTQKWVLIGVFCLGCTLEEPVPPLQSPPSLPLTEPCLLHTAPQRKLVSGGDTALAG